MPKKVDVLLVEDSEDDAVLLAHELGKGDFSLTIQRVENEKELREALTNQAFDVIISDYLLPRFSGLDALRIVQEMKPNIPFILVSGKIGEETAVEAMRLGANDYVMKGNLTRLNFAMKRAIEESKIRFERSKAVDDLRRSYEDLKASAVQLEEANKRILSEAEERKRAQAEAIANKEFLSSIIDSASELVISFDKMNRIVTWNKTAQSLTGYRSKEVINRSVEKLNVFANPQEMAKLLRGVYRSDSIHNGEFTLRTKAHSKKIVRASGSVIRGIDGDELGVIFLGRDITPEIESHGKLIDGMSYLVLERDIGPPIDLLTSLARTGYHGLLITRSNPDIIASLVPVALGVKVMSLPGETDNRDSSGFHTVISRMRDFAAGQKRNVILLDGVHYLIGRFGFEGFLQGLFEMNDIAYQSRSILMVRLDPGLLDAQRMAMIENELYLLPSQKIENIIIEDEVYDLLRYVFEENRNNSLVSIKKVMAKFQISFVTAAKRIEALENDGLLMVKKQGKMRTPFITDKGKSLLQNRRSK